VDVGALEREITRLWKDAAGAEEGGASPVTRTCLLNLVLIHRPSGSEPNLAETLASVFQARPCRILLLEIDGSLPPDSLAAWISAYCTRPAPGSAQVCCEQLTLRGSPDASAHLPGLASSLAVSDLPVCLFAPEWPLEDLDLFRRIADGADRVIVDSAGGDRKALEALVDLASTLPPAIVGDLNWGRLLPYQWAIAGLFDSPLLRQVATEIDAVETDGGEGSAGLGRLLAGWVRAALGGRQVSLRHTTDRSMPRGRLREVRLRAGSDAGSPHVVVERDEPAGTVSARAEISGACPLPRKTRFLQRSVADLLCSELDRAASGGHFHAGLRYAAALP
jgi:glucose-6-phosphate dehydrogenase assembly protein OpcA